MSDIFKKTYTVAEPGCGLTVFSMEGSEINLFGSYTLISTSAEDFFEPIKDFLHEKFVEEKADTMYHIGVGVAAVLGVLAGVAIGVAVCTTFGAALGVAVVAGDTALKFLEAGFMLAGASLFVDNYTSKTLASDKALGYDRSWPEFAGDMLGKIDEGAVAGSLVYAASYKLAAILAGIFMSGGPPLAGVTAAGEIAAGAVEVTTEGEMVIGLSDAVALVAAAIMPGKGGESKEGVEFEKQDKSGENISNYYQRGKKKVPAGSKLDVRDVRNVKSPHFKEFIRSQGKSFKSSEWDKIMETWITPDGRKIKVHYWKNSKTGEIWRHK